jgi:ATP-dependent DNA ligase
MKYKKLVECYEKVSNTSKRLTKTYYVSELIKKTDTEEIDEVLLLLNGRIYPPWDKHDIGVAARLIIKALVLATGTNTKKVEKEWKKTGDLGVATSNMMKKKEQSTLFSSELSIKKVFNDLRKLSKTTGKGAVDQKIKIISGLLSSASDIEAQYIVRTVLEDLRVGIGDGTIRDAIVWSSIEGLKIDYDEKENSFDYELNDKLDNVIEGENKYNKIVEIVQNAYDIKNDFAKVVKILRKEGLKGIIHVKIEVGKPIKVMLYQKAKDIEDAFSIVGKPAAFEYKYDGFRCISGYTSLFIKDKGVLSVRDVKKGDYVYTHKGNFKKILATNKRVIDKNERLFEITSFYGNSFKISEGHEILVFRAKPTWIPVEELEKKDKLIFPKFRPNLRNPFLNNLELRDNAGYSKKIPINNFFFRFLGYWTGDGFTNNYNNTERVGIIFNKKDKKLAKYYELNILKYFGINSVSKNIHNGAIYLYWRDKPFREWLTKNFRKDAHNKNLDYKFLGIDRSQFNEFLKGWIESDGHEDKEGRITITTKERNLAMIGALLGQKFNKMIGIKKFRVNNSTYYKLVIPKSSRGYSFDNEVVLIKILSIKELKNRDSRTTLYNLQVEDDESYCTSMVTLHNCQIHKKEGKITIFTRRLDNVTRQFPDVVKAIKENVKGDNFILDTEVVGYNKEGKYLPFQSISQRIKRKYDIERMAKEYPVELNVFDILANDGKTLLKKPFSERRKIIEKMVNQKPKNIILAEQIITEDADKARKFYKKALDNHEEGVMVKNLDGIYKPGSRVGYGVKVKPTMENLDLVIVGAEWGKGKRQGWLSSFHVACRDDDDNLLDIGKVGTGIKELKGEGVTFDKLTKLLKPLIIEEKGSEVKLKPEVIIEVSYEEIQKSPKYSSGYALRFPRLIRIREDRALDDISTLDFIEELYFGQK